MEALKAVEGPIIPFIANAISPKYQPPLPFPRVSAATLIGPDLVFMLAAPQSVRQAGDHDRPALPLTKCIVHGP